MVPLQFLQNNILPISHPFAIHTFSNLLAHCHHWNYANHSQYLQHQYTNEKCHNCNQINCISMILWPWFSFDMVATKQSKNFCKAAVRQWYLPLSPHHLVTIHGSKIIGKVHMASWIVCCWQQELQIWCPQQFDVNIAAFQWFTQKPTNMHNPKHWHWRKCDIIALIQSNSNDLGCGYLPAICQRW